MDGVLIDLLNAKWNTFVKFKFYKQFFTFAFYFLISLVAFTLRPGPPIKDIKHVNATNTTILHALNSTETDNTTALNVTLKWENITSIPFDRKPDDDDDNDMEEWWDNLQEECRLMQLDTAESQIRLTAEVLMVIGAFSYLAAAFREARFLGGRMFFENLVNFLLHLFQLLVMSNCFTDDGTFKSYVSFFLYFDVNSTLFKTGLFR